MGTLTDCYEIVNLQSSDGWNKDCEAHIVKPISYRILSWTVASNRTYSVLSGIFKGSNEAQATSTWVFFRS